MVATRKMAVAKPQKKDELTYDKKVKKTVQLDADMISEIFSRLPAKSIFKFKSCSKYINELTKKRNFALKQTENLSRQYHSSFFIQVVCGWNSMHNEMQTLLHGTEAAYSSGIPSKFLDFINKRNARIILSKYGMLLCVISTESSSGSELLFCNPATQRYYPIATPPNWQAERVRKDLFFDFMHNKSVDVDNEEYQLVLFQFTDLRQGQEASGNFVYRVYSPKEGVWKERELSSFMGTERCYDFIFTRRYILSCNIKSGETRRILYPKVLVLEIDKLRIFNSAKVRESNIVAPPIGLVTFKQADHVFTFWVLRDHESSSWSKCMTLRLKEMGIRKNTVIRGFTVMNGVTFVFTTRQYVYRYDLVGEKERGLEIVCRHKSARPGMLFMEIIPYSNTLCSWGSQCQSLTFHCAKKKRKN